MAAQRLVRVVGLFVFLWLFVRGVEWRAVAAVLGRAEAAGWFAAGVCAYAIGQVCGGLGWRALLQSAGSAVSIPAMLRHDLSSVFWSTILPGGVAGEVVKGVRLTGEGVVASESAGSGESVPRPISGGAVAMALVVARLVSGTVACALALALMPLATFPYRGAAALAIGATASAGVAGLVAVRVGPAVVGTVFPSIAARLPVGVFPQRSAIALAASTSLACHLAFAVVYAMAFRVGGAPLSLPDAALFAALSSCVEALPISVGGFGLREWTVSRMGAALFPPLAANAATLALTAMVALAVGSGGLVELWRVRTAR